MMIKHSEISFADTVLNSPETAISQLDLIYVNRKELSIERLREKQSFLYMNNGKPILEKHELDRIQQLVIPPAWDEVKIAPMANAHLQAIGRDARKRLQYRYHQKWTKIRNQTKFYKMAAFGKQLPRIRRQIERDLKSGGWPKRKVLALIIRLMEETHIRIGNETYAKRNKTYGLSTLRNKHVKFMGDKLRFEFKGKKGKQHRITLRNKKLIQLVNRCEEIPGWELFQFFDKNNNKHSIDSGMVNQYIHEISGELFTAKDFRTWAASILFFESLKDMSPNEDDKQIKKNILRAYDRTAKELGNTRNVCRTYYVHPLIPAYYEDGNLYTAFEQAEKPSKPDACFTSSEKVVLGLIKKYRPLRSLKRNVNRKRSK